MRRALLNGIILGDEGFVRDRALLVSGERIEGLVDPRDPRCAQAHAIDLHGRLLLPGFIDTQVNGGGGVQFNADPSVEAVRAIGTAHRRYGTTSFLPTLITDDLATVARAIEAVVEARRAAVPGVIGIHVEGPFLSEARKGMHDPALFRELDATAFALLTAQSVGTMLLTLAPEVTTPSTIQRLSAAGVTVSAGHTNATYRQIDEALRHGLKGFTHLFNAMSQMNGREPGVVGAALSDPNSWCGIIVDGRHVDPVMLRLALRCKAHDRFMLVTDAMAPVGSEQQSFQFQGRTISVRDGVCVDEDGTLAGSMMDMAGSVRNAVELLGLPLEQAVRMASTYPAEFLGLGGQLGRLAPGYRANLVIADAELTVRDTWIDGRSMSTEPAN